MEDFFWITIPKKLKEFRMRFNVYDRDGDGIITINEMVRLLHEMDQVITRHEIEDMMRAADLDSHTDIHFDEFLLMAAKRDCYEESASELKEAFKIFDNGKGYITETDLKTIMLNMGDKLSEEELDDMLNELPTKGGKIKISAFIALLCR
ncbi:hypothetical protein ACF0H5_002530 [Mactra antiquata]